MTSNIQIRNATISDPIGIAEVHVKAWRETYSGLVDQSYLDSLLVSKRAEMWTRTLSDPMGNYEVLVADDASLGIIGFVALGPSRSKEFENWGEIGAIYLLRSHQKTGTGKKLFTKALRRLKEKGFNDVFLWVLENNPTRGFYEKVGGKIGVTQEIEIGAKKYQEIAYKWKL